MQIATSSKAIPHIQGVINFGRRRMKFKLLGDSGLRVSEMALGAMTFGSDWG